MTNPEPGDKVLVTTDEKAYEGILMPNEETDATVLKLSSGYNIGIAKEKVKEIKVVEKYKEKEAKKPTIKQKQGLPKISILHTGGTIASKVDYETGGVVARFSPEELVGMFPEIVEYAEISSRLIRNMWSQDMRFAHYNIMAKEVEKEIKKGADGIVITHGTDTLHYSTAALAFILEDLPVPVILVASQRSSDRGSSDAYLNLINGVYFAAKTNFAGVAACMHASSEDKSCDILPAMNIRKMHTTRRDAFKVIKGKLIAKVDYSIDKMAMAKEEKKKEKGKEASMLKLRLFDDKIKVGILKQHTNMYAEEFSAFKHWDGLVIETCGLGNLPTSEMDELTKEHTAILEAMKTLQNSGTMLAIAPQTIYGRIMLNVYSNQRPYLEMGILGSGNDMIPETAFIKLAWLLSNYEKDEIAPLYNKNLRGEVTERTIYKEDFLA